MDKNRFRRVKLPKNSKVDDIFEKDGSYDWSGKRQYQVKVFEFLPEQDEFKVTTEFEDLADYLGLREWSPVVWIGRLFTMDDDVGEHWFDNWDLRERRGNNHESLIVDPERFRMALGKGQPCHKPDFRKRFWTDVLCSLEISLDLMFEEARNFQGEREEILNEDPDDPDFQAESITELGKRIREIESWYAQGKTGRPDPADGQA